MTDLDGQPVRTISLEPARSDDGVARQTAAGLRILEWAVARYVGVRDENGKQVLRINARHVGARISPDGSLLAAFLARGDRASDMVLYEAASGKRVAECLGHTEAINSAAFSPDGKRVASASEDRLCCLWDVATGVKIATCRGHASKLLSVAFRADAPAS